MTIVSWQLVGEVLDHAPAVLTSGERLVLIAVAEYARAPGRTWTGNQSHLTRRAGLSPDGTRRALRKLAERGLDARVALGVDRHGAPIYAVPGRAPTFAVPPLSAPADCPCDACSEGGTTRTPKAGPDAHLAAEGGTTRTAGQHSGPPRWDQAHGSPAPRAHPHRPEEPVPSRAPARAPARLPAREAQARHLGISVPEIERLIRDCRDCGGTGRREDADGRPTRDPCDHRSVLGGAASPVDTWRRAGTPA